MKIGEVRGRSCPRNINLYNLHQNMKITKQKTQINAVSVTLDASTTALKMMTCLENMKIAPFFNS